MPQLAPLTIEMSFSKLFLLYQFSAQELTRLTLSFGTKVIQVSMPSPHVHVQIFLLLTPNLIFLFQPNLLPDLSLLQKCFFLGEKKRKNLLSSSSSLVRLSLPFGQEGKEGRMEDEGKEIEDKGGREGEKMEEREKGIMSSH